MELDKFIREVSETCKSFNWIRRIEIRNLTEIRAWLRLFLNDNFVEVFHNSKTGSTSYAYIEKGRRVSGVNNMRIGWHIHPFNQTRKHKRIKRTSIKEFLKMLEIGAK